MIPCTYIFALNSDKLGSSRNPLFFPFSNYVFYNNKEHGYFRFDCKHIGFRGYLYADKNGKIRASEKSNKMSCQIEQIKFEVDTDGMCSIFVHNSSEIFHVNSSKDAWISSTLVNKQCGRTLISSLRPTKDGAWLYKFKSEVQFPNRKFDKKFLCKTFEDTAGVEYSSKFQFIDLNCKQFVMI